MYFKPLKNFTYPVVSEQDKLSEENQHEILEGRFRNLNFHLPSKRQLRY